MRRAALLTALFGLVVVALTSAAIATTRGWPATLPHHLAWFVAAGLGWAAAVVAVPRLPASRAQLGVLVVVALALRVPAWLSPPAHSDDAYRYRWDGRVQRSGVNPYRFAPDAPELAALRDGDWARINNRELPTIYPPLAELAFAAAPSPWAWKLMVGLADAAVALALWLWLGDPRRLVVWLWSPLVVMELALNAHVDALGIALVVGALAAWARGRHGLAGALAAAAAAVKLLPATMLLGMRRRRALVAAAATALVVLLPYVAAGPRLAGSLGEYGRRWRVNDGAFAIIHAGCARLIAHSDFAGRRDLADSPRLARLITGRDRDTVFPDEVAGLCARAVAAALFFAAVGWALRRWVALPRLTEVAIGAFVLLTPALHPWYVVWLLPLVAAGASWAWIVLAVLAPLGYRPLDGWLVEHVWRDPTWTRGLEHGLTLGALAIDRWQASGNIVKFGKTMRPRTSTLLGTALLLCATNASATTVRGSVLLPAEPRAAEHESHWRVENGVLPLGARVPDPRAEVIVVLEGAANGKTPLPNATVTLHGLRMDPRVVVVPLGGAVEFKNDDRVPHTLYIERASSLMAPAPTPAGQSRTQKFYAAGEYRVRDEEYPHIEGTVLVQQSPFYARLDDKGGFKLEVPEGKYTLKVFWRDKWVATQPIEVGTRTTEVTVQVPAATATAPAAAAATAPAAAATATEPKR